MPKLLAFFLLACFFTQNSKAQLTSDSIVYGNAAPVISKYYIGALGEHSPLYNGIHYIEYAFTLKEGYPYFESQEFMPGEIYFDGMVFHDVPMYYDLVKDIVVIQDFRKVYKIVLPADKVQQFTLSNHTFIRIEHGDDHQVKTGFYDQLFKGKISVLVKRQKKIIEKKVYPRIELLIDETNTYYIVKDGIYHRCKNKNGLLDILNDKRKGIEDYFKKNEVRFKTNPERAMIAAAEYYNRSGN
jgi:hypothetical protein